ncbi:MAG: CHAD domain-containing protein [Dokdonella sp.]
MGQFATNPPVTRAPGVEPGARLREYASAELAHAIDCLGWRGPRMHTGVHQARKSLRRTRATFALAMPALGPGAGLIDGELRRINRSLSKLRDTHALVTALNQMIEKATDDPVTLSVLRRARRIAVRKRTACARKTLAADPLLQDKRALLDVLHAGLSALKWKAIGASDAATALQRSATDARNAAAKARASHDDEDWHQWRRRARRLSQQQRAIGDASANQALDKHDKRLAILLGQAQDHALLIEHCGRKSLFAQVDRLALRALATNRLQRLRERLMKLAAE